MIRPNADATREEVAAYYAERERYIDIRKRQLCAHLEATSVYRASYDPDEITTNAVNQLLDEQRVRVVQVQTDCCWITKGENA